MKKLVLLLTVVLLAASESHAGLLQTFGIGANATSQGEAVVAHANDPFAVYYNPAGLTLIKKPVVTTGVMIYDAKVKITDFKLTSSLTGAKNYNSGPGDFESDCDPILNPNMGFAMPINEKWSFGIAAYAPYGLHLEWEKDYTKNPGALYAWESKYARTVVTPGFGYKISDKLSVGFGLSLGKSISDAGKTIPIDPANPTYLKLESEDDFNWSFNVGIMYRPIDQISLGLTYRSRTDADFEGDVLMNGNKASKVKMDYDHPECVQAGVRYFANKDLSVEFDMIWTRWGILDEQVEESPIFQPGGAAHHDRDWTNEIQYKVGLEWKVTDSFALRTGYTYDPTPVPNSTFDLGWPDTDRNVYNLGFGWDITERWHIDGVIQHVRSTSVRKISGDSGELNHNYGKIVSGSSGGQIPADTVAVSFGDEGILWGYGINVSYTF